MSKADKMFEELGLKRSEEEYFEDWVTYYSKQEALGRFVTFDKTYRYAETNVTITPKLHLAIHEKMKELGWIEGEIK